MAPPHGELVIIAEIDGELVIIAEIDGEEVGRNATTAAYGVAQVTSSL